MILRQKKMGGKRPKMTQKNKKEGKGQKGTKKKVETRRFFHEKSPGKVMKNLK